MPDATPTHTHTRTPAFEPLVNLARQAAYFGKKQHTIIQLLARKATKRQRTGPGPVSVSDSAGPGSVCGSASACALLTRPR